MRHGTPLPARRVSHGPYGRAAVTPASAEGAQRQSGDRGGRALFADDGVVTDGFVGEPRDSTSAPNQGGPGNRIHPSETHRHIW